jgi:integrase
VRFGSRYEKKNRVVKCRKRKDRGRITWIADVSNPFTGERVRLDAPTKRAAEERAEQKKQEWRNSSRLIGDPEATLDQFATSWLAGLRASGLKPKTIRSYSGLYHRHIAPTLGSTKLRELKRSQVKALLAAKSEETFKVRKQSRNEDGKITETFTIRTFSRNSVRLVRATLSTLLAEALDDELIGSNPAAESPRRRGRKGPAKLTAMERQKAIRPFTEDELQRILSSTTSDQQDRILFLLLARTGMRPGEAFALRWSDVDFVGRKILVERALSDGEIGSTKTGIIRTVDMSQELAKNLKSLLTVREIETLKNGWGEVPPSVFVSPRGKLLEESKVRKRFVRALASAGVSSHRLYDLRHTFVTTHLAKETPITWIAQQCGHARPSTTLAWYAPLAAAKWSGVRGPS